MPQAWRRESQALSFHSPIGGHCETSALALDNNKSPTAHGQPDLTLALILSRFVNEFFHAAVRPDYDASRSGLIPWSTAFRVAWVNVAA